jgi:hypothetical protein
MNGICHIGCRVALCLKGGIFSFEWKEKIGLWQKKVGSLLELFYPQWIILDCSVFNRQMLPQGYIVSRKFYSTFSVQCTVRKSSIINKILSI